MSTGRDPAATRWRSVALLAGVLLVGAVLPSPLGRHPEFSRVGPDKALHFAGHGAFAVALADALAAGRADDRSAAALAVALSTGYGVATGALQRFVPGRVAERTDVTAGFLGSVLATTAWRLNRRHRGHRTGDGHGEDGGGR